MDDTALPITEHLAELRKRLGWILGALALGTALSFNQAERIFGFLVDPVIAASGGEPFLDDDGIDTLLELLLPRGPVLTPNLIEAARLSGRDPESLVRDPAERVAAAHVLIERGASGVLVTGGHGREDPVHDLVLEPGKEPVWLEHPRIPGANLHGSGCRYASAVAVALAGGSTLTVAAAGAAEYVHGLLPRP